MKIMIQIEDSNGTRVIPDSRLRTVKQYADRYVRADGRIGCSPVYIHNLIELGKLPYIKIAGQKFVVLPDEPSEKGEA